MYVCWSITCYFVGRRDRGDPIGQEFQGFVQRIRLRAVQGRGKFKDGVSSRLRAVKGRCKFKDEVRSRLRAVQGRGKFKSMCSSRTG